VAHKQFVEIAREIDKKNLKILVLDEPTAVLSETEAERLLDTIRYLAGKGVAILFISHRLSEVLKVSDRITILRDGAVVDSKPSSSFTVSEIAEKWSVGSSKTWFFHPARRSLPMKTSSCP
jgi:simple sugar transport system ATP-binding protein